MRAEIVGVGTEILLGQIANTNAQWISKELAHYGISVYFHSAVGDNLERVVQTFEQAGARSDIVIITGGLGPTEDDLTRDAASMLFQTSLKEDEKAMSKIEEYFKKNSRTMTENNRKQALVLDGSVVLQNDEGMAPGQMYHFKDTLYIFLPGVPSEMKRLMSEQVFPYLVHNYQLESEIKSEMLRFVGIGESKLEHELQDLISQQSNPTIAPLAGEGDVAIRLTASGPEAAELLASLKSEILQRVGSHYFGSDSITVEEAVQDILVQKGLKAGSAESLTGGKFIEKLISLKGASSICEGGLVAYTPSAKKSILKIPAEIIETYGTVSEECAAKMAENAQKLLDVDIAVSFTGVAGPAESEGHKPGLVYIGLKAQDAPASVFRYYFDGSRDKIRGRAVIKGYELLFNYLKNAE
ncbi:competence/damage-inducible protein A [Halobacillus sp. Marseille-Q1614]|uniref:competence/damage-inducible protein A n=1 Tax=Halobacillus sp. Marseille-Q1614 TaxID=2709134 RepID=UPI00156F8E8C|nr:competence/damage-inducible protein A [Halobacillus sp. Marseille-Q1614]